MNMNKIDGEWDVSSRLKPEMSFDIDDYMRDARLLQRNIGDAMLEYIENNEELESKVDNAHEEISLLKGQANNLARQKDQLKYDLRRQKAQMRSKEKSLAQNLAARKTLEETNNRLCEDMSKSTAAFIAEVEREVGEKVQTTQEQFSVLEKSLQNDGEVQKESLRQQYRANDLLRQGKSELQGRLEQAQQSVKTKETELISLRNTQNNLSTEITTLRDERDHLEQEGTRLRRSLNAKDEMIEHLKQKYKQAAKENQNLGQEVLDEQSQNNVLHKQKKQLKHKLKEVSRVMTSVTADLEDGDDEDTEMEGVESQGATGSNGESPQALGMLAGNNVTAPVRHSFSTSSAEPLQVRRPSASHSHQLVSKGPAAPPTLDQITRRTTPSSSGRKKSITLTSNPPPDTLLKERGTNDVPGYTLVKEVSDSLLRGMELEGIFADNPSIFESYLDTA